MSFPKNTPEESGGPSSSAFYLHFKDPARQSPPSSLRHKPRLPQPRHLQEQLEQRQETAAERRAWLEDQKVQQLSVRLARVALITDRHQRQATSSWHNARERISRDMDEHVRRRTAQISKRLRNLNGHNQEVQERRDEVKRERFLRKLDHLYESKNASTISQFKVFKS